jgi:hypothetical protein
MTDPASPARGTVHNLAGYLASGPESDNPKAKIGRREHSG